MKKIILKLLSIGAIFSPAILLVSCSSKTTSNQTTSTSVKELFDGLFPTWPTMLATVLSLLILLFVLTKFLYKPIKKSVEDRKKYIQNNIDEAENQNQAASSDREKANAELIEARKEAATVIAAAKIKAEQVKSNALITAKEEAELLIKSANEDIEIQKAKFAKESKQAIVDVALTAAAKIVEKEVDSKVNKKIIKDFIDGKK